MSDTNTKVAPAAKPKLVSAVVSPRRSLTVNGKTRGPGSIVELPELEVQHLRSRGFLVRPNETEIPLAPGPKVFNDTTVR